MLLVRCFFVGADISRFSGPMSSVSVCAWNPGEWGTMPFCDWFVWKSGRCPWSITGTQFSWIFLLYIELICKGDHLSGVANGNTKSHLLFMNYFLDHAISIAIRTFFSYCTTHVHKTLGFLQGWEVTGAVVERFCLSQDSAAFHPKSTVEETERAFRRGILLAAWVSSGEKGRKCE